MKKCLAVCSAALLAVFLVAGSALALPYGGISDSLNDILDGIHTDGSSTVDAEDYLSTDAYWEITGSGGSVATIIVELAGFANDNIFGIFSNGKYVPVFGGLAGPGAQATIGIANSGEVFLNHAGTGVFFNQNLFGFYLQTPEQNVFHSDDSLNGDGKDHMLAYQGTGTEKVQLPGWSAGIWTVNEYILAFEDLFGRAADNDYDDFVVMVESVRPVPVPAALWLLGSGVVGLIGLRRKMSV